MVNSLLNGSQNMNKFFSVLVLGSALALSACGGDSDSSGSTSVTSPNPAPKSKGTCVVNNNTIIAPTTGCTYAATGINNSELIKYTCTEDNRISSNGSGVDIISKSVVVDKVTIQCANATPA